jgi:deoxyribonuclease-4
MHLSFSNAPQLAREIGCQAVQVFCGNPRGWKKSPLDPKFVEQFRAGISAGGISPLVVHATYLINLAAPNERIYRLSCDSFVLEVARAAQLGAQYYVVHIGSHQGSGAAEGRRRVAACVKAAVRQVPNGPTILVENTAGGGSSLGGSFADIAAVIAEVATDRIGLCLDTCHALAAGYDVRSADGVKRTLDELERTVGFDRLHCLHLNDSKGALGSHIDRHEHIGEGQIGEAGFRALLSDKRLWQLPAILETPRDDPMVDDPLNVWHAIQIAVDVGAVKKDILKARPLELLRKAEKARAAQRKKERTALGRGRSARGQKRLAKR